MRLTTIAKISVSSLLLGVNGCSWVAMDKVDGITTIGRTMEFAQEFGSLDLNKLWQVMVHPKGTNKFATDKGYVSFEAPYTDPDMKVTMSITPPDGMNEDGLTISGQTLRTTDYQPASLCPEWAHKLKFCELVPFTDFIPFVLGRFGTVEELLAGLKRTVVYDPFAANPKLADYSKPIRMHYAVTDATGASVVLEYMDGALNVHQNDVGVFTNDPDYPWHLKNLQNYANLQSANPVVNPAMQYKTEVGTQPLAQNHGLGLHGLPGDFSPASRFVKMFYLREFMKLNSPLKTVDDAIVGVSAIMDTILIPRASLKSGYTPYSVIKQPESRKLYFRSYDNMRWKMIDVTQALRAGQSAKLMLMEPLVIEDRTKDLKAFDPLPDATTAEELKIIMKLLSPKPSEMPAPEESSQ